jgi:acyl carrier protein
MTDTRAADVADKLEMIIAGLVSSDRVPVRRRTRLNSPSWDSLFQLTLVVAIEQEFGVTLTDTDVLDLNSFTSALHILEEKLASR